MNRMLAVKSHATALSRDFSRSFARLRERPSQASVRRAPRRRGRTSKPQALRNLRMISKFHASIFRGAPRSLSPAYPPPATMWRSQRKRSRASARTAARHSGPGRRLRGRMRGPEILPYQWEYAACVRSPSCRRLTLILCHFLSTSCSGCRSRQLSAEASGLLPRAPRTESGGGPVPAAPDRAIGRSISGPPERAGYPRVTSATGSPPRPCRAAH